MDKKCVVCGETKGLKRGWTNRLYCSKLHEVKHVSELHASMFLSAGPLPKRNWLPYHISQEINKRWENENERK
jgi:hypothetical protein